MSMISEQIQHLKSLQEAMRLDNKLGRVKCDSSFVENRIKIIEEAIDTIETLSAKIQANNFNNGWIKCEDRLPDEKGEYLVMYHPCIWDSVREEINVGIDSFRGKTSWAKKKYQYVIAWQPLPESYKDGE